jgi:molybdopterin/thiamine biosynthesis adenylyltransferase
MKEKRILIVGAGALGSSFLDSISGEFSKVGIFDGDIITKDNLKTQPFYEGCNFEIPLSKAEFAANKMGEKDKTSEYVFYNRYFMERDEDILKEYDYVIDFTDNLKSRLVINKAAVNKGIPAVFASINEKEVFLYFYNEGNACFNCIYRNSNGKVKEGCDSIISPLSDKTISFIKDNILSFIKDKIYGGSVRILNISKGKEMSVNINKDPQCEECSKHSFKIDDSALIQVCAAGIKFSSNTHIDLKRASEKIKGSKVAGDYLFSKNDGKSILISSEGDFLFTGYELKEARELLSFLKQ